MPTSVGNLWVDVRFDTSALGQNLRAGLAEGAAAGAAAAEATLGQRMSALGAKATVAGRQISYGLSIPLIAFGKVATNAFADFDQKMTRITALSGVPREQVQAWEEDVKSLASTYGQSATDTAEALYFITSSGIEAANAMAVLEVSAKGAAVGLGQQQEVADLVTSAMNAYGHANITAAEAGDILTASVRLGKAEADKMAGALAAVIPLASNLKVPMAEISGAMASMTLSGTSPDEAATQLRNLFNVMGDMEEEAKTALKAYTGIDYATMRANISTKGFITTLKEIFDTMKAGGHEAAIGEIFGPIRAQTGLLNLFGEKSEQTLDIIQQVKTSAGDLNKAWADTADTASFKLQQATEDIKTSLIDIGAAVAPAMTSVSQGVAGITSKFGELPGPVQTTAVALGAAAAAAGPLTYSFGALNRVGGGLLNGIGKLTPKLRGMSDTVRLHAMNANEATKSIGGLTGVFGSVAVAIGTAAAAYVLWNDKMDEGKRLAADLGNTYREAAGRGGIAQAESTIAKARAQIEELERTIAGVNAPWDLDFRAQMVMGREELEKGVYTTQRFIFYAQEMAKATGQSADAMYDWLVKEAAAGRIPEDVAAAINNWTAALRANQPAAVEAAAANDQYKSSLDGVIAAAKGTADKFMGLIEAQRGHARAQKAITDAVKAVGDAEEKASDATRARLAAERAIGEAQRKAVESTNAVIDAKQRLIDAQNELNDALAGPSPEEQLDLESAQLAVQEAAKRARGPFSSPLDRRRAQLDLRRARLDLEREQEAHDKKLADSRDKVTDAEKALNDAQQAEVDANQAVVDAIEAREDASRREADAYEAIATARDNVRIANEELVPATANLAAKQAELETAIYNSSANGEAFITYLEKLKEMEPGIAGVIDDYIRKYKELQDLHKPPPPLPPPPAPPPGPPGATPRPYGAPADARWSELEKRWISITNPEWPGRARGGPVSAGSLYEVNERNIPELLLSGTRQFLLPVDSGQVVPLEPSAKPAEGPSFNVGDINVYEVSDGRGTAVAVRRELRKKAFLAGGR